MKKSMALLLVVVILFMGTDKTFAKNVDVNDSNVAYVFSLDSGEYIGQIGDFRLSENSLCFTHAGIAFSFSLTEVQGATLNTMANAADSQDFICELYGEDDSHYCNVVVGHKNVAVIVRDKNAFSKLAKADRVNNFNILYGSDVANHIEEIAESYNQIEAQELEPLAASDRNLDLLVTGNGAGVAQIQGLSTHRTENAYRLTNVRYHVSSSCPGDYVAIMYNWVNGNAAWKAAVSGDGKPIGLKDLSGTWTIDNTVGGLAGEATWVYTMPTGLVNFHTYTHVMNMIGQIVQ